MSNDTNRNIPFQTHAKPKSPGKSPQVKTRSRASEFLIDTGFWPLVLIGKGVKSFGWSAVMGFCLGAAGVYGYAFTVKSLPLVTIAKEQSKDAPPPTQTTAVNPTRWLHGVIKSDNRPVTEDIEIGVLATRNGPFQSGDFSIQVPQGDHYQITLWNQGYQRFKLVELRPDVDGNVHDVNFPSGSLPFQASNKRNPQRDADVQVESAATQLAARSARSTPSQSRSSLATR